MPCDLILIPHIISELIGSFFILLRTLLEAEILFFENRDLLGNIFALIENALAPLVQLILLLDYLLYPITQLRLIRLSFFYQSLQLLNLFLSVFRLLRSRILTVLQILDKPPGIFLAVFKT